MNNFLCIRMDGNLFWQVRMQLCCHRDSPKTELGSKEEKRK